MVYTSESLALAVLEVLAHLGPTVPERPFVAIEADVPDDSIEELDLAALPPAWRTTPAVTRGVGAAWLASKRSLVLAVPSVLPSPASSAGMNYLVDPGHPRVDALRVIGSRRFELDRRLLYRMLDE